MSVERGAGASNERPRVGMLGRFPGQVAGIEFLDSGIDVLGVELDAPRNPVVAVDFDDGQQLEAERLGQEPVQRLSAAGPPAHLQAALFHLGVGEPVALTLPVADAIDLQGGIGQTTLGGRSGQPADVVERARR